MSSLDPSTKSRLVKLLGMLGSAHDGEALTAGRLADRLVRQANLTWDDIIAVKREMEQRLTSVRAPRYEHTIRSALKDGSGVLSRWEVDFLHSLLGRTRLTDKQASKLSEIIFKVAQARRSAA